MKKIIITLFLVMVFTLCYGLDPNEIIAKSDKQFIPDMFTYNMTLRTTSADGKIDIVDYKGKKKHENNIMITINPASARGQVNLKNRNVLWSYFPTSGSTVKQSYQAIILGTSVSYGDILALELSRDYNVRTMIETSSLSNDQEQSNGSSPTNKFYLLTLGPKKDVDGYAKIFLWIDEKNFLPVKREYYALSGLLVKACEVQGISFDEKGVASEYKELFFEPLKKKQTLVTIYNVIVVNNIPDTTYNPKSMKFFSGE